MPRTVSLRIRNNLPTLKKIKQEKQAYLLPLEQIRIIHLSSTLSKKTLNIELLKPINAVYNLILSWTAQISYQRSETHHAYESVVVSFFQQFFFLHCMSFFYYFEYFNQMRCYSRRCLSEIRRIFESFWGAVEYLYLYNKISFNKRCSSLESIYTQNL